MHHFEEVLLRDFEAKLHLNRISLRLDHVMQRNYTGPKRIYHCLFNRRFETFFKVLKCIFYFNLKIYILL